MFHYDNGIKLTQADLAVDIRRRQPRAFVSHAHSDHMARHAFALCTASTAKLYQHRLGPRPVLPMAFLEPIIWGGLELTAYPAGHCLGSAMLLARDDKTSLLYTGDFKLDASATCRAAELPQADILITESTFGDPKYRFPPRDETIGELRKLVRSLLESDLQPVIEAYALGKAQEVTKILTDDNIPVAQNRQALEISQIYQQEGIDLGELIPFDGRLDHPAALIMPPGALRRSKLRNAKNIRRIAVTGWAMDPSTKYRLRVDHAIPLSDHADFDQLLQTIELVNPKKIFVTHGPIGFVDRLLERGMNAYPLDGPRQNRLF